jgi:hypothetical protein
MAIQLQPTETAIWRIVQAIIQLVQGRQDSVGDVTLAVGATSTAVDFVNCSRDCRVFLMAQSAAAMATPVRVAVADIAQGSFVIRHGAAPAGAVYSFTCLGG